MKPSLNLSETFDHIYKNKLWSEEGLGSGTGSSIKITTKTRQILIDFINENLIRSMIDVSCGRMNWMPLVLSEIKWQFDYLGLDIVEDIIKHNTLKHQNSLFLKVRHTFKQFDITKDAVPLGYDLIHCRDTLQHLPYEMIILALENFARSDFKWIFIGSYNTHHENRNILMGDCFNINLLDPPFSFPKPCEVFSESTKIYRDEPEKFYLVYDQNTYRSINFFKIRKEMGL